MWFSKNLHFIIRQNFSCSYHLDKIWPKAICQTFIWIFHLAWKKGNFIRICTLGLWMIHFYSDIVTYHLWLLLPVHQGPKWKLRVLAPSNHACPKDASRSFKYSALGIVLFSRAVSFSFGGGWENAALAFVVTNTDGCSGSWVLSRLAIDSVLSGMFFNIPSGILSTMECASAICGHCGGTSHGYVFPCLIQSVAFHCRGGGSSTVKSARSCHMWDSFDFIWGAEEISCLGQLEKEKKKKHIFELQTRSRSLTKQVNKQLYHWATTLWDQKGQKKQCQIGIDF